MGETDKRDQKRGQGIESGKQKENKEQINKKIDINTWNKYFKGLIKEMEGKVVEGKRNGWREWNKQAGNKKIRWLKNKAIEGNGMPNEAWKYAEEKMEKQM